MVYTFRTIGGQEVAPDAVERDVKARKHSHSSATARFRNAELAPKIRAGRREGGFSTLLGG